MDSFEGIMVYSLAMNSSANLTLMKGVPYHFSFFKSVSYYSTILLIKVTILLSGVSI